MMKVAFRVDSGHRIGGGHLTRCLTLAHRLRDRYGAVCLFIMKEHPGNLAELVEHSSFDSVLLSISDSEADEADGYHSWVGGPLRDDVELTVKALKSRHFGKGDLLISDHYGIDADWEGTVALSGVSVGVIDDLANRYHNAVFLVDQTIGRRPSEYRQLVRPDTVLLTGTEYCLLRDEFISVRNTVLPRCAPDGRKTILLNFGSSDPRDYTIRTLTGIRPFVERHRATVVVVCGASYRGLDNLRRIIQNNRYDIELHVDTKQMAELMAQAHIGIGAAGTTTWERCALGLPSVIMKTAENQADIAQRVAASGAALPYNGRPESKELSKVLESILLQYDEISKTAADLVDARGVERICSRIEELINT